MPIAEFNSSAQVDVEASNALSQDGAVIMRRALSNDRFDHLRLLSIAAFAIMDLKSRELERGQSRPDDHLRSYVETYRRLQYIGEDVVITLLSNTALANPTFSPIADALIKSVGPIFPSGPIFVPTKSVLRRQGTLETAYVVWHRDVHAVQTVELENVFNCWVPCEPVGIDRPSLQVVLGSNNVMKQHPVNYAIPDNPDDDQVLSQFGEESICTAILDPGDVLIFSDHTIHRTQPMNNDALTRTSGEFRFRCS
jgi:ectoine hydroxylase-related dioxygenase (phytanoyl-CoA dioxygenase family)